MNECKHRKISEFDKYCRYCGERVIPKYEMTVSLNKNPDWRNVRDMATEYISFRHSKEWHEDNDFQSYMFEAVLKTLFGDDIFEKFNKLED